MTKILQNTCLIFMTNMLLSMLARPLTISLVCVNHITYTV